MRRAFFDAATNLDGIGVTDLRFGAVSLVDVSWGGANLSSVRWETVRMLGDERKARRRHSSDQRKKDEEKRLREYEDAVRANRQLAITLRIQGLSEHADRFAYRAQVLQRNVLRREASLRVKGQRRGLWWRARKFAAYLGSWFLAIIAGYGYRPGRSILIYLAVVLGFATGYFLLGQGAPLHLTLWEAVITSIISFHGRGFFPTTENVLANPIMSLVAAEAIIGLLIEITFIATFTNRFFTR